MAGKAVKLSSHSKSAKVPLDGNVPKAHRHGCVHTGKREKARATTAGLSQALSGEGRWRSSVALSTDLGQVSSGRSAKRKLLARILDNFAPGQAGQSLPRPAEPSPRALVGPSPLPRSNAHPDTPPSFPTGERQ